MKDAPVFIILALAGFGIATAIAATGHKPDAWDANLYWSVGLPSMALLAGIAGYLRPHRTWSFGFVVIGGSLVQMVVEAVKHGEVGSMWPIGLAIAVVLALGCGAVAWLGSKIRRRTSSG